MNKYERFREFLEWLPEFATLSDSKGSTEGVNAILSEFMGLTVEDLKNNNWQKIDLIHPDDLDKVVTLREEFIKIGKPFVLEYRLRRNDGEYRWFKTKTHPVIGKYGEVVKWVCICNEIHDAKIQIEDLKNLLKKTYENIEIVQESLRYIANLEN